MALVNVGGKINLADSVANIDNKYGPYTSTQEAWDFLGPDNLDVLAIGLTVGIQATPTSPITEYWFKNACETVEDLIPKITGGSGAGTYSELPDKPSINNVELSGNKSLEDLGIVNYDDAELRGLINDKQETLISGTNIKTINNQSILGEGNIEINMPTKTSDLTNDSNFIEDSNYVHTDNNYSTEEKAKLEDLKNYDDTEIRGLIGDKQETLVSGTNIKTINNTSILGSGNIEISGSGSSLPIINVKDFGATGDGATDDTQAIQNALDSVSTGGTIFFPKGIYMLSTCLFNVGISGTSHAIEVYSNQRLLFEEGATLKRGAAAVNHMLFTHNESNATGYTGAENIEIIGATIDGNKSTYGSSQTPINLSHTTNVRIINCIFKNIGSSWHAMEINSSLNTVVDGCRFEKNSNTEDIQLDAAVGAGNVGNNDGTVCKDTVIKNCVFDMTSGVAIGNHTNAAHANTRIYNNVFKGTPNESRGYLNFVTNHKCIDVYENTFYGGALGIVIPRTTKDSTVHNNRFEGTTTPYSGTGIVKWTNFINNVLETGDINIQRDIAMIENNLTNVSNSNSAWVTKVGSSYTGTLTVTQESYIMGDVAISMNGLDVTSTVYDELTGIINIANVTGDIVITASAYDDEYATVTNVLTNVTNSNTDMVTRKNESYTGTLSTIPGYIIDTTTIMMGQTDITSTVYDPSTGAISIENVTDNLTITATAVEDLTLPTGYTRVEALSGTGTQYIETDYVFKANTELQLDHFASSANSGVNYQTFLGASTADNAKDSRELRYRQKTTTLGYNVGNNYDLFDHGPVVTKADAVSLLDTVLTVDGTSYDVKRWYSAAKASDGSIPMYIFCRNLGGIADRICKAELGMISIYEDNTLMKRFIPALDADNVPCYYEKISGTTLYNKGTGTFDTIPLSE